MSTISEGQSESESKKKKTKKKEKEEDSKDSIDKKKIKLLKAEVVKLREKIDKQENQYKILFEENEGLRDIVKNS